MDKRNVYQVLTEALSADRVLIDADMREFTSFKAGGKADLFVSPANERELAAALRVIEQEKCDFFLMGNGTNFLVRDGGYRGVVMRMGEAFRQVEADPETAVVKAQCGALLSQVAKAAAKASLCGFEFACGIPGSLGGAIAMNAGAYGGEIKDVIAEVRAMDRQGTVRVLRPDELKLGYRHSIFQKNGGVILEAQLQLQKGEEAEIKATMRELNRRRNEKQPVNYPSAGSFFKRPQGFFAGKLIQEAHLKGLAFGDAQVSALHGGFIINRGNATASDIINLMKIVQNTVWDQFGVRLEPEVKIIGEERADTEDVEK